MKNDEIAVLEVRENAGKCRSNVYFSISSNSHISEERVGDATG